jgi:hypothetical protein
LERFRYGGSFLVPLTTYNRFIKGAPLIGRADGIYITTFEAMDALLTETHGSLNTINARLAAKWNEPLIRIDIPNPLLFNIRMPSGLEEGANEYYIPGGYTRGGMIEAVIDQVPHGAFSAHEVTR